MSITVQAHRKQAKTNHSDSPPSYQPNNYQAIFSPEGCSLQNLKLCRHRSYSADNFVVQEQQIRVEVKETKTSHTHKFSSQEIFTSEIDQKHEIQNYQNICRHNDKYHSDQSVWNLDVLPFSPPNDKSKRPNSSAFGSICDDQEFAKSHTDETQAESQSNYHQSCFDLASSCFSYPLIYDNGELNTLKDQNNLPQKASSKNSIFEFKHKEKTEICKNWLSDRCRFGDTCSFAHGYDQIQKKSHCNDKYKLTRCKGFHEQGFCPYGARCQFAHVARENINSWSHALEQDALQFKIKADSIKEFNYMAPFSIVAPQFNTTGAENTLHVFNNIHRAGELMQPETIQMSYEMQEARNNAAKLSLKNKKLAKGAKCIKNGVFLRK